MNYVFYHSSDLDGICSAAIFYRYFAEPCMVPWEYKYEFPQGFNPTFDDTVIFVDVTANPYDRIAQLLKKTNVIVIDHHFSFIEWARQNIPSNVLDTWVLDIKKSACMLAWEYAHPGKQMPKTVELLGRYDIWDNADIQYWNETILPFQYSLRGMDGYKDVLWNELLVVEWENHWIDDIIRDGFAITQYLKHHNESIARKHSFPVMLDGYRAIACNTHNFSSQTFESVWDENQYDLMVAFEFSKGESYWVSFYTTKPEVDVSKIATKYGGGGHKQASGCTVKKVEVVKGELKLYENA